MSELLRMLAMLALIPLFILSGIICCGGDER
jgi:hypothetical protein